MAKYIKIFTKLLLNIRNELKYIKFKFQIHLFLMQLLLFAVQAEILFYVASACIFLTLIRTILRAGLTRIVLLVKTSLGWSHYLFIL